MVCRGENLRLQVDETSGGGVSLFMALLASVELLTFCPQSARGLEMFDAIQKELKDTDVRVTRTDKYQGESDLLCLWGPGAPNRWPSMSYQSARGKHSAVFDLAYWQRDTKIRVSIDDPHPQKWVMKKDWPASRLLAGGITISDRWDPSGTVIVAGIGPKAKVQYGAARVEAWEVEMIAACRAQGRPVQYRRKNGRGDAPLGVSLADTGSIESVIDGASLLVTWHSNVAVDAIRMGIPVVCRDGAAAAVCSSELTTQPKPLTPDVRDRFLRSLAWFQFAPSEAYLFWRWINEALA